MVTGLIVLLLCLLVGPEAYKFYARYVPRTTTGPNYSVALVEAPVRPQDIALHLLDAQGNVQFEVHVHHTGAAPETYAHAGQAYARSHQDNGIWQYRMRV